MTPYHYHLKQRLSAAGNPDIAEKMKQYMRGQFEYLGIQSPAIKQHLTAHHAEHGLPPVDHLDTLLRDLWSEPEREYAQIAILLLKRFQRKLTPDHLPLLESLITTKSWWDTVDMLATHPVSTLFKAHPPLQASIVPRWRTSKNIWLIRSSLLFQLKYKHETDEALLFSLIREHRHSDEFFIQKAIGWALREYSRTAPDRVRDVIASYDLKPLSRREGLKLIKKDPLPATHSAGS